MLEGTTHKSGRSAAPTTGETVRLHVDGREIGSVEVLGWDSTWTYGRFTPCDDFQHYATIFGRWSLLMHDDPAAPMTAPARDALADAERQLDALHVQVYFPNKNVWRAVRELNIDGGTAEWKEV